MIFCIRNFRPSSSKLIPVLVGLRLATELQRLLASYRGLQQRFQQRERDLILAGDLNAGLFSTANNRTADRRFTALFAQYPDRHPPAPNPYHGPEPVRQR